MWLISSGATRASPNVIDRADLSVVIRTRDEADRLRLTLTSLVCQRVPPGEVVVVDDGSVDHTRAVLAEMADRLPLRVIRHEIARGRAAASNAGARAASSRLLLFFDGDMLASPRTVEQHVATHRDRPRALARGEVWHLRCTRLLLDPEKGTPRDAHLAEVQALSEPERQRLKVTRAQIRDDFAAIERRARPGVYPGFAPGRLHALEMEALRAHPDCRVLWAAASGSNFSVARTEFEAAGGFDERLDINEHRELALRLCGSGGAMVAAGAARAFHMIHRSGWRDPLRDTAWFDVFANKHPTAAVRLLPRFWADLAGDRADGIRSLPQLAERAASEDRAESVAVQA